MQPDYDCWQSRSIAICDARLHRFTFDFFNSHFFALRFAVVSQCPEIDSQTAMRNRINYSLKAYVYQELAEFSIEVDNAQAVLRAIGYECELVNSQSMGQLVSNLPAHDADR